MGKVKGKHRLDKYYHLAKEQGYRSRAAFKLLQLESKFNFLESAHSVLDLCAAPGGWMQVAVQRVPVTSFVLGIDLFAIRPIRGAVSVQEDITTTKCRATIKRLMSENGCRAFDVVLHDGSPNVGGAWAQEATTQVSLVVDSVKLATEFLAPKGTFVSKVFRSQDYCAVLYCLKQLFAKVEVTKPVASRSSSAEIYVVGQNYLAPAKIDPRLLDVKHLFQGGVEPPKVLDVLRGTKQKRHRDGYEDGNTTLRKVCLVSDFVWSESPLDILGSVSSISFDDPACESLKNHSLTTEEIRTLCDDLRVLGKQDFKGLLKWRIHIRKALSPTGKATCKVTDAEDDNNVDEDEKILNEMEELAYTMEHKKKRAKKLLAKRQAKDKSRKKTGMQVDAVEDGYVDHELFSLSSIKGKKDLKVVEEDGNISDNTNEKILVAGVQKDSSSDIDSDEERKLYDEQLEDLIDQAYERYVSRVAGSAKQRKRARNVYDGKELYEVDDYDVVSDQDSDKDQIDSEVNPLMVPLQEEDSPTPEQITEDWFRQDIFAEAVEEEVLGKKQSEDEMEVDTKENKNVSFPKEAKANKKTNSSNLIISRDRASKVNDYFEVVPAPATDSSDDSSSSDESEVDNDNYQKQTTLGLMKKMVKKKLREQIIDDGYNRYMFDDDSAPIFLVDDEKKHCRRVAPVTKEEIAAMKVQFKEINARPGKKVAQAKARKKRVAMRQLDKVRQKANTISDQTDINDRSKRKLIDQLYKKAQPKKPKKEYVVAKKGVQVKALGKGKVLVDRRMKKDLRSHGIGRHGKGSSKNGKNGKGPKASKGPVKGPPNKNKGKKGNMAKSF